MPSLNDYIDAQVKDPSYKLFINGRRVRDVVRIEVNHSLNDSLSSARVETLTIGSIKPEDRIQIQQGYNSLDRLTFTGIIDTITYNEYEQVYTLEARDVLKKALDTFLIQEVAFGHDPATGHYFYSTYTALDGGTFHIHEYADSASLYSNHPETVGNIDAQGAKAEAVVQWLLHMSGLAEGREIQVDDTNFYIGDLGPAKFHMESVYDAAQRIAQLIGWRIYADAGGVARFRRRPRNAGGYTSWKYTTKTTPKNIHTISRFDTNMDLRTYVEVRGASGIQYVARGTSPYLGNTAYRGVLISNELIDTPGIAKFMGDRVLSDLNRLKTTINMQVDGNPILTPASTLLVSSNVTTGNFLLEEIQTTMSAEDGYKANLTCSTYPGSTTLEPTPSGGIVADFVPIQVVSFGDPTLVVTFDGSSSYSDGATIVQWSWDWPDGSNTTEADPIASFPFDQALISNGGSQTVTLTVTDSLGQTASVASGITYASLTAGLSVLYRQLYAALTTQAAGSIDGGATWNALNLYAISCAASNFAEGGVYVTSGYALFGTSQFETDIGVYRTDDYCASVTKVLDTGSDPVTAVHIAELDGRYALAGTKAGLIYSSQDSGITWTQVASLGYEIREVRHAYTNYQYISVIGSGVGHSKESFDRGAHFSAISPVSTLDINRESSGSSTNYYAHQTGVHGVLSGTGTALAFSGGVTPAIVAITVAVDNDAGVMIVDANGQHWNYNGSQFNPTTNQAGNKSRHNLRDGEVPKVVYYATSSGVYKSLDNNETLQSLYIPAGVELSINGIPQGWGKQVAYGPLAPLATPARLIYRGAIDDTRGIFVASGQGWANITTLGNPISGPSNATAGYFLWGETAFNMIKLSASGLPTAYINYASLSPAAAGGNTELLSILISRKIGLASGVLPKVYGLVGDDIPDLQEYANFFVDPTQTNTVVGFDTPSFTGPFVQHRMPYNKDIVHSTLNTNLFGTGGHWFVYDGDLDVVRKRTVENEELPLTRLNALGMQKYLAFSEDWWFAYQHYQEPEITYIVQGASGESATIYSAPELSGSIISEEEAPTFIYDSSLRRGGVYVAYPFQYTTIDVGDGGIRSFNECGIYFVEGYGRGRATQLLAAPAGYEIIKHFSVTHDRDETQDYLAVIFRSNGGSGAYYQIRYSLDGGFTWASAPSIDPGISNLFALAEVFYVASLDTS